MLNQNNTKAQLINELTRMQRRVLELEGDVKAENRGQWGKMQEKFYLFKAALESTADGILVVNENGVMVYANDRFADLWKIPQEIIETKDDDQLLDYVLEQLVDPEAFLAKVRHLYESAEDDFDALSFKDGRLFERYSRPLLKNGAISGRVWSFRDISERQQAQKTNTRLGRILEKSLNEIYFFDTKTLRFAHVNLGACRNLGYSSEEIKQLTPLDLKPEFTIETFTELIQPLLDGEEDNIIFETIHRRKDGSTYPVEVHLQVELTQMNPMFVAYILDITKRKKAEKNLQDYAATLATTNEQLNLEITERKKAEVSLQESEKKYFTLFSRMPIGIYRSTPDGRIIEANPAMAQFLGYPDLSSLLATNTADLYVDSQARNKAHRLLDREGIIRDHDIQLRCFDGSVIWVRDTSQAIEDGQGEILYYEGSLENITDRVQAQEILHESEERLRILFEFAPDGMYLHDLKGTFVDGNKAAEEIIGYKREELIGKSFFSLNLLSPSQIPRAAVILAQNAMGKPTGPDEFRLIRKDGSYVPIETRTYPVSIRGQKLVLGTARDITDRQHAVSELRKSENKYRTLFNQIVDPIFIFDKDSRHFLDWNQSAFDTYGYSRDELLSMTPHNLHPPEELLEVDQNINNQDDDSPHSYSHVTKNEDRILVEVHTSSVDYEGQEAWISIVRDITERARAERALKQYAQQLETFNRITAALSTTLALDEVLDLILDQLSLVIPFDSGAIFLVDGDELVVVVDRGITPSVKGKTFPADNLLFQEILRTGEPIILDNPKDDSRFQNWGQYENVKHWMGIPLFARNELIGYMTLDNSLDNIYSSEQANHSLSFAFQAAQAIQNAQLYEQVKQQAMDLEDRVEARTQELRDAQEQLLRQEKLMVLGQMAGGISHELRNPLAVMQNAVYYLKKIQPNADDPIKDYLDIISSEVQDAGRIISNLLEFARKKKVEREEVDINKLVEQFLSENPPPENVTVLKNLNNTLSPVFIDQLQIRMVLRNLVSNAYQSMEEGGKIAVETKTDDRFIMLIISDTGVGISPESMKNIFEPLYTTKSKGIGLGLVISKYLVEANGGIITVESVESEGSTFIVRLPKKIKGVQV